MLWISLDVAVAATDDNLEIKISVPFEFTPTEKVSEYTLGGGKTAQAATGRSNQNLCSRGLKNVRLGSGAPHPIAILPIGTV
jgi:hypothetical protein